MSSRPVAVCECSPLVFPPTISIGSLVCLLLTVVHIKDRKIQTVKDLSRPWAALTPLPPSPSHSSDRSTPPPPSSSPPESSSPARPAEIAGTHAHSALTTLLLDDSPKKAAIQPYNHFCIPEYTQEWRNKDLESFQKEQEWALVLEKRELLRAQEEASALHSQESTPQPASAVEDDAEPHSSKKRKRKASTPSNTQASLSSPAADDSPTSPPEPKKENKKAKRRRHLEELALSPDVAPPEVSYDETLLAVVGVLDAVRTQRNVAAWVHAGRLWGPIDAPVQVVSASGDELGAALPEKVQADGTDDVQPEGRKKRKKPRHRVLRREAEDGAARPATAGETVLSPAGNDEVTAAATPPGLKLPSDLPSLDAPEVPNATMWFEDPQVMAHWATRGREVLEELGIPAEHGMER